MVRRILWSLVWLLVGMALAMAFTGCSGVYFWRHDPTGTAVGPPVPDTHIQDIQTRWLLAVNAIVACVMVVAMPVCIGLAIWLRSAMFGALAVAALGMLIVTMVTKWILYHTNLILWCAGGVVLIGIAGLVFHLWRNRKGLFGAIRVAEVLKPPREFGDVEKKRKAMQTAAAGAAAKVIDEARVLLKLKTKKPAPIPKPAPVGF